jgi:TonB family protein
LNRGINFMDTFGAPSFLIVNLRGWGNDLQRRRGIFSSTLSVFLLFCLFPTTSSSQGTFISRKHQDLIWERTVNGTDMELAEPDSSIFVVPASYRIVEVSGPTKTASSTAENAGADILSDTRGVDFGPYVKKVKDAIFKAWRPIIPESARPPQDRQGRVGIRFKIDPDGSVKHMVLEFPSGDVGLDRAAWGGITGAAPYPPLPVEFNGPFLELRLYFYYNLDPKKLAPAK